MCQPDTVQVTLPSPFTATFMEEPHTILRLKPITIQATTDTVTHTITADLTAKRVWVCTPPS